MRETTIIEWNVHRIEFIPVLSHKTFWMATVNELWFDGELVATSGGFNFSSRAETSIQHDGKSMSISVESSTCWRTLIDLNYTLIIDGNTVSQGITKTKIRW